MVALGCIWRLTWERPERIFWDDDGDVDRSWVTKVLVKTNFR
jgi:hypothetical protein